MIMTKQMYRYNAKKLKYIKCEIRFELRHSSNYSFLIKISIPCIENETCKIYHQFNSDFMSTVFMCCFRDIMLKLKARCSFKLSLSRP